MGEILQVRVRVCVRACVIIGVINPDLILFFVISNCHQVLINPNLPLALTLALT